MTIKEAGEALKKKIPYRNLVRAARHGDDWIFFTENMANGGKAISGIIDNGYFIVDETEIKPISLTRLPNNLNFRDYRRNDY